MKKDMKRLDVCSTLVRFVFIAVVTVAFGLMAPRAQAETDKYRLIWNDDPSTTMTIGWCMVSGSDPYVKYGTYSTLSTYFTETNVTAQVYDNTAHPEGTVLTSNFVKLTGLSPNMAYYFCVTDSEGDGPIMWFKTGPDSATEFTFVAGGDSRSNAEPRQHGNILVSKIRPLFVAHGGDYMNDCTNDEMRTWLDEWQLTKSSDDRMYPVIPAHGNHENDVADLVEKIFNMPNPDGYYALGVGGNMMRLYTLNTELEPGVGYGAFAGQDDTKWNVQKDWLGADMPDYEDTVTWMIANYHRPMRPHQSGKAEGLGRIQAWAGTFYDNGLDLAMESDSHLVKYTFPVKPDQGPGSYEGFIRDDVDGAVFIGEGSWGAPHRANDDDKPWTLSSDSFWQFKLIHAGPTNLDIRTVKFGSQDEAYDPSSVTELTQAEQDIDSFALPAGLDLWQPLAGEVLTLPFTGADVDNAQYAGAGGAWKYLDDGSDQGAAWQDAGFDDTSWASGPAQLGYGDGDEATVISYGSDPDNKYITCYFRNTFDVADPSRVIKLNLMLLRDDGAVVYINGNEAVRSNMPDGDITYTTPAASSIGGTGETAYYDFNIGPAVLQAGTNTIAVEVHQSSAASSDVSFDLALYGIVSNVTGAVPAAPAGLAGTALSESEIALAWTDNATDEVGYELWRKVEDTDWQIYEGRLGADTESFNDIMLAEGTTYTYKVRAYSQYGLSPFSNEMIVTTLTVPVPEQFSEDFEDGVLDPLIEVSVTSDHDWHVYEYSGAHFAKMNGYGADDASDDWLITPPFNLYAYTDESISCDLAYNYGGPELEVLFSADYDPDLYPDPGSATWWDLNAPMPSTGGYTFENTGKLEFNIISEDFESDTPGIFTAHSRASNADWHIEERAGQKGAFCNGFGADEASDDWLISSAMELPPDACAIFSFDVYSKYNGPEIEVKVSTNYSGSGDPLAGGVVWENLPVSISPDLDDAWESLQVDLSAYNGTVYLAFRYLSSGTGSGQGRRWGVDNIKVQPDGENTCVAFHYVFTGTDGGDGRTWEVDNIELRANPYTFVSEDFDVDDIAEASFSTNSVESNADWHIEEGAGQKGAFCNGYGADGPSNDWLISPAFAITPEDHARLSFDLYSKYSGPELEVFISTDYSGSGDPGTAAWFPVNVNIPEGIYDEWIMFSDIDISSFVGESVYVAFRYTSTGTGPGDGRRWGVDNVQVTRGLPCELIVDFAITPAEDQYTTAEPITFLPFISSGVEPFSYLWIFGNGDNSTVESPTYTYPAAGVYTVSLTVTDDDDSEAIKTKTNYITVVEATEDPIPDKIGGLRIASFNCYMNRNSEGRLISDLSAPDNDQIQKVAEIIQRINPDVILLNEFDYDDPGEAASLFKTNYLEQSQNGAEPVFFDYEFLAESNTGIPTGYDLDNDGSSDGSGDCYGWGDFPGQYGMLVLSKFPILTEDIRTFQHFLWEDMPEAIIPPGYYNPDELEIFRLSSKSHWDVPIVVNGNAVHVLCSHPTPPVFDGPEDRNGRRNHDEIRLWADYVTPAAAAYLYDDDDVYGGLDADTRFVILGDQNADPVDGDSTDDAILQLLDNPNVNATFAPESSGAAEQSDDASDTASWGLRADYVLPSSHGLVIRQGGVFWPITTDILYRLVEEDGSSDHRLVWLDLTVELDATAYDIDGDGDVDRDDINIIKSHHGEPASVCPECDIDGDGVIKVRDARKLVEMCTRPKCACE